MTPATASAVRATVRFPLIDQTLTFEAGPALERLSSAQLCALVQSAGDIDDYNLVSSLLRRVDDETVTDAFGDYGRRYGELSRELREYRGYGLDGDEEPELTVAPAALLDWLAKNKPNTLNAALVDHYSTDIVLSTVGRLWTWSTAPMLHFLPAALAGRTCAQPQPSRRKALADIVEALDLKKVFLEHCQAMA